MNWRWQDWIKRLSADPTANITNTAEPSRTRRVQSNQFAERWRALSRYDDDFRDAVDKLRPFGDIWVDELARAYFALNEDRQYLPSIVSRLLEEAKLLDDQHRLAEEQRRAMIWRQTADGEPCTEESLDILRRAEARGYALAKENETFKVTKIGFGTTYLRSNYEIREFGKWHGLLSDG